MYMERKVYILNENRYIQVEIEVGGMAEDKTIFFLVPQAEETKYMLYLNDCLYACRFTVSEVIEDAKENNMDLFYMCTMFDDRIEHEA